MTTKTYPLVDLLFRYRGPSQVVYPPQILHKEEEKKKEGKGRKKRLKKLKRKEKKKKRNSKIN